MSRGFKIVLLLIFVPLLLIIISDMLFSLNVYLHPERLKHFDENNIDPTH